MKERGTLNDMTFAHAVHDDGPRTATASWRRWACCTTRASCPTRSWPREERRLRALRPRRQRPGVTARRRQPSTKPANVKLATTEDGREAEAGGEAPRATKLAMAAAEEKAKAEEQRRAAEKARRTKSAPRRRPPRLPYLRGRRSRRGRRRRGRRGRRSGAQGPRRGGREDRRRAQAYADEAKRAGNAEAAAEAETIAQEARAAVAEARGRCGGEHRARHETRGTGAGTGTNGGRRRCRRRRGVHGPGRGGKGRRGGKKEAADIAAAKAKAALEPLAKAREAARAATCTGWHQTGRCTPDGPRETHSDRSCDDDVPAGASGYCQCGDGQAAKSDCDHASFKCQAMCAARQAYMKDGDVCEGWRQTGGCSPHGHARPVGPGLW